jgi:hypothetical protein
MRTDNPAPPVGETPDVTRLHRSLEAVIAQYIQDLIRTA